MSDSEEDCVEKQLKIIFLGEVGVGKTSIIKRFCQDEFTRQYTPTAGADFYTKHIVFPGRQDITLIISDVGGQELNGTMLDKYVYNTNIIVLVYDITSTSSFDLLPNWIDSITGLITKPTITALFGNKCDLEHQRAIRLDKTQHFAKSCNLKSYLVSARTGEFLRVSLMELIAKQLGIHLSKLEKEKQQSIVRAELIPPTPAPKRTIAKKKPNKENIDSTTVFIEKYTENVRFCIICNYLSKIIPALQSRCTRFRFAPLLPEQILPRLDYVIEEEKLTVTEDGKQALLTLAYGDMRKVLNVLQSTWLAFKYVNENNVYTCVGHPLKNDIENIIKWLLNDDFKTTYDNIKQLKTVKGLALSDILTEIHRYVHRIEFPFNVMNKLLDKMANIEHRLAAGASENLQLTSLVAAFQYVKDIEPPTDG